MTCFFRRNLRQLSFALLAAGLASGSLTASAQTVVGGFETRPADDADLVSFVWYDWFTTGTGVPSTVSLTGLGGDLEANQPLPTGAALLTTELDNADRTNVGLFNIMGGTVGEVVPTLTLGYDFYKAAHPSPAANRNAAAALKLEIYNETCDETAGGDCYATLIWEAYQNGYGNFPTQDIWQNVAIDADNGSFWTTGGFGLPSGGGGCPCRTLNEYVAASTPDFAQATIVSVQIGVGSYNQGQIAYFDNVTIGHEFGDGLDLAYNFESIASIEIDLRPNNSQNQVNTNSKALVPIAILGSADFDPVSEVDPDSVVVRGAAPIGTKFDTDDVNGDGYDDLTLYFRARTLDKPSEAECSDEDAKLELNGSTFGGSAFAGVDSVTWQGPDCP